MSKETLGLLIGFIGVAIFGGTLPATRFALESFSPWFVTFGRAALAGMVAVVVLGVLRRRAPPRADWPRFMLASLCLAVGFPVFSSLAMQSVPASHGGVVLGLLPLATTTASALMIGARPSPGFWACGVLGALVVVAFTLREGAAHGFAGGDLFLLGAIVSAAVGYTVSGELSRHRPGWEMVSWMLVFMLPVSLPLAWLTSPADWASVTRPALTGFLYISLCSQYIGFFFWNAGMALGGVARVAQVQLLQSFVTLAIAAGINGEHVDSTTILVACLVLAIVFIGRRMPVTTAAP